MLKKRFDNIKCMSLSHALTNYTKNTVLMYQVLMEKQMSLERHWDKSLDHCDLVEIWVSQEPAKTQGKRN